MTSGYSVRIPLSKQCKAQLWLIGRTSISGGSLPISDLGKLRVEALVIMVKREVGCWMCVCAEIEWVGLREWVVKDLFLYGVRVKVCASPRVPTGSQARSTKRSLGNTVL